MDVVFFRRHAASAMPSRGDDDQASADLHHWQRNPKNASTYVPTKYDPISRKKTVHGNTP